MWQTSFMLFSVFLFPCFLWSLPRLYSSQKSSQQMEVLKACFALLLTMFVMWITKEF